MFARCQRAASMLLAMALIISTPPLLAQDDTTPVQPVTAPQPDKPAPDADQQQHWKGAVILPSGELTLHVRFSPDPDAPTGWTAFLDIPAKNVAGAKMSNVVCTKEKLAFDFAIVHAAFRAAVADDGQSAVGTLDQNGMTFTLELKRQTAQQAADDRPKRPQTPKPPFPYEARDVTFRNEMDNVTIAGTLTIPAGPGPFPAVLLITGSGPQDRDETIMGHKPFWVIADHLSRNGIAVLRCDDRGIGGTSSPNIAGATTEDFARDALAGVHYLATLERIDANKIGLIGHSEGGIIAPIAAARSDDVHFIVLLAGTGLPGADILRMQTRLISKATGRFNDEQLDEMEQKHRALTQAIISDAPVDEQRAAMLDLIHAQELSGDEQQLAGAVAMQLRQLQSPWFRYFLTCDPRTALRKVKCPVLALGGSLDIQVPPDENLAQISQALTQAGNTDVTTSKLPGLNHLFQHATTGTLDEYAIIEETFAPQALDQITDWILKRFATPANTAIDANQMQVH